MNVPRELAAKWLVECPGSDHLMRAYRLACTLAFGKATEYRKGQNLRTVAAREMAELRRDVTRENIETVLGCWLMQNNPDYADDYMMRLVFECAEELERAMPERQK